MKASRKPAYAQLMLGASAVAFALTAQQAVAQEAAPQAASNDEPATIVVTGIRASLQSSLGIKRDATGVVDAISALDIGKFPDTNLAESLQRITGVSIDRNSGEGSTVTVRGFGPDFNLVLLNGRQMPTSTLGDGASASSATRSRIIASASCSAVPIRIARAAKRSSTPVGAKATSAMKTTGARSRSTPTTGAATIRGPKTVPARTQSIR